MPYGLTKPIACIYFVTTASLQTQTGTSSTQTLYSAATSYEEKTSF